MKLSNQNTFRIYAVLITLAIVMAEPYIPPKRLLLLPSNHVDQSLYSDKDFGGKSDVRWLNKSQGKWYCNRVESDTYPSCGYSISFQKPPGVGLDFSGYQGFKLQASYQGDGERVRVFLRNFNPAYATVEDTNSNKFMSMVLHTKDLNKEVFISFDELSVIDWWISDYDIPRELSAVEFKAIEALGIDHMSLGEHTLTIHKIELVGDRIQTVDLYLSIILLWMSGLIYQVLSHLNSLRKNAAQKEQLLNELQINYKELEEEKTLYEKKSTTDHLTGAQNRTGIQQFVDQLTATNKDLTNVGLMIFDIDNFKRINDRRGHDTGDRVLKAVSDVIALNTRDSDMLGRWGGEEFLLISDDIKKRDWMEIAEKLRLAIAHYPFEGNNPLTVTISIGVTRFRKNETFIKALKRADDALYAAKKSGRNCCVYQD